jgi:hypothetical protein
MPVLNLPPWLVLNSGGRCLRATLRLAQ